MCVGTFGGVFWLCFFLLGPSLNSRNLTLKRATGCFCDTAGTGIWLSACFSRQWKTDDGRGVDVQRGCSVGGALDISLEGSGNVRIFCGLL